MIFISPSRLSVARLISSPITFQLLNSYLLIRNRARRPLLKNWKRRTKILYLRITKKIRTTTQVLRTRQILTYPTILPLISRKILASRFASFLTILNTREISTFLKRQSPAYIVSIKAIRFLLIRLLSLQRTSIIVIVIVLSSLAISIFVLSNIALNIQFVTLLKASYTTTCRLAWKFLQLATMT